MKNNIYFFQPQNLTGFEGMLQAWLPYSVSCLWAYASQYKEITDNFNLDRVYCTKEPIDQVLDFLKDPKICGFSSFVWNFNYNLTLARRIKERWPDCVIVFGGPQITLNTINEHPFIDTIIESEGEILFKNFLDDYLAKRTSKIYYKQRIKDLTILPSAYLTGIFDQLIEQYPDISWATTLETNRGCPYHCTFCDWGSVTNSKVYQVALDKLTAEVEWIKAHPTVHLVNLADANFGIMKERDLEIAKLLRTMIDDGGVKFIEISYTKSYNTYLHEIVAVLDQPTGFTVSFQSHNQKTLDAIKRKNLNEKDLMKLLNYAEDQHVTHEQEYILGLPLETKESWYDGMTTLLDKGQHKVFDVFLCSILPNTELYTEESRKTYGIKTTFTPELNSVGPRNRESIAEFSEIIKETNTLPEKELIDCFLFSIIIMHAHCTGYTFVLSRIANNSFKVSNLAYYTELEKLLYADPIFGEHLNYIRTLMSEIFATGIISDPNFKEEGRFDYLSYQFFYKNKNKLFELGQQALINLSSCTAEQADMALELQYNYIFDLRHHSDTEFQSVFNIDNFTVCPTTTYKLVTNLTKKELIHSWKGNGSFHKLHQRKLLVNSIQRKNMVNKKIIPIDSV